MKRIVERFLQDCQNVEQPVRLRIAGSDIDGSDLCARVENTCAMFDVRPNIPVCIRASNGLNWIVTYFAAKLSRRVLFVVPAEVEGSAFKGIVDQIGQVLLMTDSALDWAHCKTNSHDGAEHDGLITYDLNGRRIELPPETEILFTSGTMGQPKGVVVPRECYENTALTLVNLLGMTPDHREILAMPFGHSFGLGRLRAALFAGCCIDVYPGLGNTPRMLKSILDGEVHGIGLVPAALEVFRGIARRRASELGEKLQYIEIGSSAMSQGTRAWLNENFTKTIIWHHYGMTEASRSFFVSRGSLDNPNEADHIGSPARGISYDIYNKDEAGIGELWVTGNNVAGGYLSNPALTNEKFVDGGFLTGDLVKEMDGRIVMKGRKDSTINVGGQKVSALEIENDVENLPGVGGAICFAAPDKIFGHKPAVLVELDDPKKEDELLLLIQGLAEIGSARKITKEHIVFVPKMPKTSNGKKARSPAELFQYLESKS